MSYRLCDAGKRLRAQIDAAAPRRDTASDGWIGDSSHAATASDHNPCWTCTGSSYGVVRAIDVDADLRADFTMQQLADALIECAKTDKRIAYVIFDGRIASGTYSSSWWTWRPYSGANDHSHHAHVSFTPAGDSAGQPFELPILGGGSEERDMKEYVAGQQAARQAYADAADGKIGDPPSGKGEFFRAGWNDVRWSIVNLKGRDGKDGARGPKGEQGVQGLPGASHSHEKVSVAGPAISTP